MHKSREQLCSLVLAGINLAVTAAATAAMSERKGTGHEPWLPLDLGLSLEFLLIVGLPALLFHIMGCLLLLLYYKTAHTWRELGKERERHCCGKLGDHGSQVLVERGPWETQWEDIYGNMQPSQDDSQMDGEAMEMEDQREDEAKTG